MKYLYNSLKKTAFLFSDNLIGTFKKSNWRDKEQIWL